MPAKRRQSKRRLDLRAELRAWESTFDSGVTFDGDLDCVGIPTSNRRPTSDEIAAAWHRLGAQFIAAFGRQTDTGANLWALRQFGEPANAS